MRKVVLVMHVSMDGVIQSPGAPEEDPSEGFELGGWIFPFSDEKSGQFYQNAMGKKYEILMGRRTYEMLAATWPFEEGELADQLNAATKHVVAGAGAKLSWTNSKRLGGDATEAVADLKKSRGPALVVIGSGQLVKSLLAAELIDQITALTYPIVLGSGKRLFEEGAPPSAWKLAKSAHSPKGVVANTFVRDGKVKTGTFVKKPSTEELARRKRLAAESPRR